MFCLHRECLERAFEIVNRAGKHPLVAAVQVNLGTMWKQIGNKDKAVSQYKKALAIHEENYGPNHLKVRELPFCDQNASYRSNYHINSLLLTK